MCSGKPYQYKILNAPNSYIEAGKTFFFLKMPIHANSKAVITLNEPLFSSAALTTIRHTTHAHNKTFSIQLYSERTQHRHKLDIYLKKKKSLSLPQAIHLGRCPRPAKQKRKKTDFTSDTRTYIIYYILG